MSGSLAVTITSRRLPPRTSLIIRTERSWPTASGVIVSGKVTESFSGRTGSAWGSVAWPGLPSCPTCGSWIVMSAAVPRLDVARAAALYRHAPDRLVLADERDVDPQDAVVVGGLRARRVHVRAQLDHPPERPLLDLYLLVEAALGVLRGALAADQQLAPADLEAHIVDVHTRQVHVDHGLRRIAAVVHVHPRGEAPARHEAAALEHVAEQLVDLAPHPLEVGEGVVAKGHAGQGREPARTAVPRPGPTASTRRPRWRCPRARRTRTSPPCAPRGDRARPRCASARCAWRPSRGRAHRPRAASGGRARRCARGAAAWPRSAAGRRPARSRSGHRWAGSRR